MSMGDFPEESTEESFTTVLGVKRGSENLVDTSGEGRPRAYTEAEIREQFLKQVWGLARYWAGMDNSNVEPNSTPLDRITGFAHSLLANIDGCSLAMPGFKMTPCPAPEDKEYCIENDENWYPDDVDIAGGLHELLFNDVHYLFII